MEKEFLVKMDIKKLSTKSLLKVTGLGLILLFFAFVVLTLDQSIWSYGISSCFIIGFIIDIFRRRNQSVDVAIKVTEGDDALTLKGLSKEKTCCFNKTIKYKDIETFNVDNGIVNIIYKIDDNENFGQYMFDTLNENPEYWERLKIKIECRKK